MARTQPTIKAGAEELAAGAHETYVADPVDTDDAAAICTRLAHIEDRIAFVTNQLSRADYWRAKLKDHKERTIASLLPDAEGRTEKERIATIERSFEIEDDETGKSLNDQLAEADAVHAQYMREFNGLDTRRSILQSALKRLSRDQEPMYGQGAGQIGHTYPIPTRRDDGSHPPMGGPLMAAIELDLPEQTIAQIAEAVAQRMGQAEPDGYLNVAQAAEYLACGTDRIYDLVQHSKVRVARDGRRLLFKRAWLDEAVT
jgi:excisionase family DNA binding protein